MATTEKKSKTDVTARRGQKAAARIKHLDTFGHELERVYLVTFPHTKKRLAWRCRECGDIQVRTHLVRANGEIEKVER